MSRVIFVIGIAIVLAVSGGIGLVRDQDEPGSTPSVAVADAADFATLGARDLTSTIAGLQARLQRLPADDRSWATLGLAYVEQARVTADPSYYAKADSAIGKSLELRPEENATALAAAAALSAAEHDFTAALDYADQALAVDAYQPGALAIRVDALTELGRYDDQLQALRVADRRQPGVPVAARYSYAYELRGDLAQASNILEQAAATATAEGRTFLLTLLADLERRQGLLAQSGEHLRIVLSQSPDHVPAMAGQARLAVARGDLDAAVDRWTEVVNLLPLPEYLTELGELYEHLGEDELAQQQYAVVEASNQLLAESGVSTDMESALFEADHGSPAAALAGARSEWQKRQSVHVANAYAWALYTNGRSREALELARSATELGTLDARFWIHRGIIEADLGMERAARAHLEQGLALDGGLSPWQTDRARAVLADLGDRP